MKPAALILHATGTNRDHEAAQAIELAGGRPEIVHLNHLRSRERCWSDYQILVLPGGFSYADALGAGRLLALDLNTYFSDEVRRFVEAGKAVIGICNGFQALVKAGILPSSLNRAPLDPLLQRGKGGGGKGDLSSSPGTQGRIPLSPDPFPFEGNRGEVKVGATLTFNASGHFDCRWVTLRPVSQQCIWTRGLGELIYCPIAHGEGNFQLADEAQLAVLESLNQIALVYSLPGGAPAGGAYPHNPNGSVADIAGICNPQGNVLGLMPHPEDHLFAWQHPHWSRGIQGQTGLILFENGVKYCKDSS